MTKKWIYVAGAYSAPKLSDIVRNVETAIEYGDALRQAGFTPVVPHLCHWWDAHIAHDYVYWIDLTLEWMERCDGVLRLPGASPGADSEAERAIELGIPVFHSIDEVIAYFENAVN